MSHANRSAKEGMFRRGRGSGTGWQDRSLTAWISAMINKKATPHSARKCAHVRTIDWTVVHWWQSACATKPLEEVQALP